MQFFNTRIPQLASLPPRRPSSMQQPAGKSAEDFPGFVTAAEASKRTGLRRAIILRMCQDGRIKGAKRAPASAHHKRPWLVPQREVQILKRLLKEAPPDPSTGRLRGKLSGKPGGPKMGSSRTIHWPSAEQIEKMQASPLRKALLMMQDTQTAAARKLTDTDHPKGPRLGQFGKILALRAQLPDWLAFAAEREYGLAFSELKRYHLEHGRKTRKRAGPKKAQPPARPAPRSGGFPVVRKSTR